MTNFANEGGLIKLGSSGGGTSSSPTGNGGAPLIVIDPNLESGTNAENPFNNGTLTPISGAGTIIGNIAHELGHLEDPDNPQTYLSTLDPSNPNNEDLFVNDGLSSEAKAAYNQYEVQQQIYAANPSLANLTLFSITSDPAADYKLEQEAGAAQTTDEALTPFFTAFSQTSPSLIDPTTGNAFANYKDYYEYVWSQGGGASPAPGLGIPDATSSTPVYDDNGNLTGAVYSIGEPDGSVATETVSFGPISASGLLSVSGTILDTSASIDTQFEVVDESGDSIALPSNLSFEIAGSDDTISANASNLVYLSSNTQASLDGSGINVSLGVAASLNVDGVNDTVNGGSSDTVDIDYASTSSSPAVETIDGDGVDVTGSDELGEITANGTGDQFSVDGYGWTVTASDATFSVGSLGLTQQVFTSDGSGNVVTAGSDSQVWVEDGTGTTVNLGSDGQLEVGPDAGATLSSGSGAVGLFGGSTLTLDTAGNTVSQDETGADTISIDVSGSSGGDATETFDGNGDLSITSSGSYQFLDVAGDDDDVTVTGSSDLVDASGGTVNLGADSEVAIGGSDDTINAANGDTTGVQGNSDLVNASGNVVNVDAGTNATVVGSSDIIYAADSDTTGVEGTDDVVGASNGVVNVDDNSNVSIDGNGDEIFSANSDTTGVEGTGDVLYASNGVVNVDDGSNASIAGDGDEIFSANSDTTGVEGTGDVL